MTTEKLMELNRRVAERQNTDIHISKITVISHPVYGHTYEVNYRNNLVSDIYTDSTRPVIVRALTETREPTTRDLRDGYTITVYTI